MSKPKELKILLSVFLLSSGIYLSNIFIDYNKNLQTHRTRRLLTSDDLVPTTFLPYVIIKYNTIKLNNIMDDIRPIFQGGAEVPYFTTVVNGDYHSVYPLGTSLMALPFYLVPVWLGKIPHLDSHLNVLKVLFIGRVAASFFAAVSVALMYLLLSKVSKVSREGNRAWVFLFTGFYALGTTTWSISSRGLWMHTTSQLILTVLILLLFWALKKPKLIIWCGFVAGLAVLIRPTNIVPALFVSLYVLFNYRKYFGSFVLATIPTIILYFLYNYRVFGSPLMEGYAARGDHNWSTPLLESIPGLLFSPARSFLFISPPLVLSYFGIAKILAKKGKRKEDVLLSYLGIIFVVAFFMISKWWAWAGANGFGYRMLTEYLPIVTLFSFLVSENFKRWGKIVVIVLMIYSLYVHFNAVIFRKARCDYEHNWSLYCVSPPKRLPKY